MENFDCVKEDIKSNMSKVSCNTPNNERATDTICRLYNRGKCPLGDQCKYSHVCFAPSCRGPHPLAMHAAIKAEAKNLLRQD